MTKYRIKRFSSGSSLEGFGSKEFMKKILKEKVNQSQLESSPLAKLSKDIPIASDEVLNAPLKRFSGTSSSVIGAGIGGVLGNYYSNHLRSKKAEKEAYDKADPEEYETVATMLKDYHDSKAAELRSDDKYMRAYRKAKEEYQMAGEEAAEVGGSKRVEIEREADQEFDRKFPKGTRPEDHESDSRELAKEIKYVKDHPEEYKRDFAKSARWSTKKKLTTFDPLSSVIGAGTGAVVGYAANKILKKSKK